MGSDFIAKGILRFGDMIIRLIKYYNLITGTSESEPTNISRSIIIEFSDNGHKGKMMGHTVTNTVVGDYELLQGNKMKTLSFGGTKVGEPGWEINFGMPLI